MALVLAMLAGCSDPMAAPGVTGGEPGDSSGVAMGTTEAATSGSTEDAPASSTSGTPSGATGSTSTGAPLDGPGCGEPPPCSGEVVEGTIRVESAADLEQLAGVSAVTGHLEIIGTDLECLDPLLCLEQVGLDLRVQDNEVLRSTAGLANVSTVGASLDGLGDIVIAENPALRAIEGLAIPRIDGLLSIRHNDALREVLGFSELRRLTTLDVQDNPSLESLEGLRKLNRLERCDVNHNETLCLSEVFAVCGDVVETPGGVTDFNDDDC